MKTLTIHEAADFLKIDRTTALALAGSGELPGAKIGRAWVFLEEDIVAYLRKKVQVQSAQRREQQQVIAQMESAPRVTKPSATKRGRGRPARQLTPLPELLSQVRSPQIGVSR